MDLKNLNSVDPISESNLFYNLNLIKSCPKNRIYYKDLFKNKLNTTDKLA